MGCLFEFEGLWVFDIAMAGNMSFATKVVSAFVTKGYMGSPGILLAPAIDGGREVNLASVFAPLLVRLRGSCALPL